MRAVFLCVIVWLIFSIPRFNRIAMVAQQQAAGQPAPAAFAGPPPGARGFFRQLVMGAAVVQLNNLQNAAPQQPPQPAAVPLQPLPTSQSVPTPAMSSSSASSVPAAQPTPSAPASSPRAADAPREADAAAPPSGSA